VPLRSVLKSYTVGAGSALDGVLLAKEVMAQKNTSEGIMFKRIMLGKQTASAGYFATWLARSLFSPKVGQLPYRDKETAMSVAAIFSRDCEMKLRACLVLLSFFVFSSSFASPATADNLNHILISIIKSSNNVMEHSFELQKHFQLVRDDYNEMLASLRELASLTDVENVRSKSGKLIEGAGAAVELGKQLTHQVQQIVDDYNQLLELLKTKEAGSPEVSSLATRAWEHTVRLSGFFGETEMSHAMNSLLLVFFALNDASLG